MIQMQAQRDHRYDVEESHPPHLKTAHEIRVNVLVTEAALRAPAGIGEVKNVKRYEKKEQRSSPPHCSRRERAYLRLAFHVTSRARTAILQRELHCRHDVE